MNTDPNMSEQSGQTEQSGTQNQSLMTERTKKKQVQNPNSSISRNKLEKNQPKNVVGADLNIRCASDAFYSFAGAKFFKIVAFKTATVIGSDGPWCSVVRAKFC